MDKQPEALRLADKLDQTCDYNTSVAQEAADELRRLHQVNQELVEALEYHQEQTRPIQRTLDLLAKHKEQE